MWVEALILVPKGIFFFRGMKVTKVLCFLCVCVPLSMLGLKDYLVIF